MTPPPFRLIAIAGTRRRCEEVLAYASNLFPLGIGLMLRSPRHNPDEVGRLAAHLFKHDLPVNIVPITNGCRIPGISWAHRTSAQVLAPERTPDIGLHGASVHSESEGAVATAGGASYLMVSPIHPTESKPGHAGIGCAVLRAIVVSTACPVFALGGVSEATVDELLATGIHGLASISLFHPDRTGELLRVVEAINNITLP